MSHRPAPRPIDFSARLAVAFGLIAFAVLIAVGPATIARATIGAVVGVVHSAADAVGVELPDTAPTTAPTHHLPADSVPIPQSVNPAAPGYVCPTFEDSPGYWSGALCGNGQGADVDNTADLAPGVMGR